jgi:hypothetical protein
VSKRVPAARGIINHPKKKRFISVIPAGDKIIIIGFSTNFKPVSLLTKESKPKAINQQV